METRKWKGDPSVGESPFGLSPEGEHQVQSGRRWRWSVNNRGRRIDINLVAVIDATSIVPITVSVVPIAIAPLAGVSPPIVVAIMVMIGERGSGRTQQQSRRGHAGHGAHPSRQRRAHDFSRLPCPPLNIVSATLF